MKTRDRIVYESLKLFSVNGFEAVSTRMIAKAVDLSDSGLYKHFKSKQEILDTIVEICKQRYFNQLQRVDLQTIRWSEVEDICLDNFRFQIEDEWIVMFRRLLVIEQFKNTELARLYQSFFVNIAVDNMTELFKKLISYGYMKEGNPRVYAMQLYAPFFMYHTMEPKTPELFELLREHVVMMRSYMRTEKCDEKEVGI